MRPYHHIVLAVAILVAGLLLGYSYRNESGGSAGILGPSATLLAAFVGAWLAFELQNRKQEREEKKNQISAVNRALYMIYDMWNVLIQYQDEVINQIRGMPDDWLNMSASLEGQFHEVHFSAKDLVFLLETKYADLYARILLEEQRYTIAMGLIKTRSRMIYNQLHPRMENLGFKVGEALDLEEVEKGLGPDITNKLRQMTEGIIKNVDEDVASLKALYDDFRNSMMDFFETDKLLKIEFGTEPTGN